MCNKMEFAAKSDAMQYLKETTAYMRQRGKSYEGNNDDVKKLKPYECSECGKWHLTSHRKLKGNQLKARNKRINKSRQSIKEGKI